MKELLTALNKLYDDQSNIYQEDEWIVFKENEMYNEVVGLCNKYLITDGGQYNWDNIQILRNNGYRVFPGKKDSFGWITACVQSYNDDRVIVYG